LYQDIPFIPKRLTFLTILYQCFMSLKTQTLQISEIQISINDLFYKELLSYALESGKQLSHLKVLDWGCGRGIWG
jgi:hypothetical protein